MKFYTLILSVFISLFAYNQQQEIPYINSQNVRGIYSSGADAFALVFSENRTLDKKDIYQISFLNNGFEKVYFDIPQGKRLIDVVSKNGETFFVFSSKSINDVQILKLSKTHQISRSLMIEPAENDVFGNVSNVEINEAGNIFVFRAYSVWQLNAKNQKETIEYGTEILSYDSALNETGTYRMKSEGKIRSSITGFTPIKEGFVLTVETRDYKEKKYDLSLQIFTNDLNLKGIYVLTESESFFPTEIISDNNQLVIAGYSLKGSIFDSKDVEGLFVSTINMDGTLKKTSKYSWELLKGILKESDKGDFIFSGKMNVIVEKIRPSANGYQIICESYANNSGKTVAEFALGDDGNNRMVVVYDFVVFNTDTEGALTEVKILEKEPTNIEIGAARMSKASKIQYAYYMKKYNAFPYRKVDGDVITFVNYKNKVGYLSTLNINTREIVQGDPILMTPVIVEEVNEASKEFVANSGALTKLDNLNTKTENMTGKLDKLGNKLDYAIEKVDLKFDPWGDPHSGMFLFGNGTNVSYVIDPERHSIFFEPIK